MYGKSSVGRLALFGAGYGGGCGHGIEPAPVLPTHFVRLDNT